VRILFDSYLSLHFSLISLRLAPKMVATRSKRLAATTVPSETPERATKRIKSSPSLPSISTSSKQNKSSTKPATKRANPVAIPRKRVPKRQEEEPESEESIKLRKKNIGNKVSPGDGQLDYTLSTTLLYSLHSF